MQFFEKLRNHRDIKLVTIKSRRDYLVSETKIYHKFFSEYFLALEIDKADVFIKKSIY